MLPTFLVTVWQDWPDILTLPWPKMGSSPNPNGSAPWRKNMKIQRGSKYSEGSNTKRVWYRMVDGVQLKVTTISIRMAAMMNANCAILGRAMNLWRPNISYKIVHLIIFTTTHLKAVLWWIYNDLVLPKFGFCMLGNIAIDNCGNPNHLKSEQ